MLIHIPFNTDRTTFQTIDLDTTKRSKFQIDQLVDISNKSEFSHFVTLADGDKQWIIFPEFTGPANILWYDKDGYLHLTRIGVKRVLRAVTSTQDLYNCTN